MVRSIRSTRALTGLALITVLCMLAVVFAATPLVNEGLATNFGGFGTAGTIVDVPLRIKALALQPDGKIVAVGVREQTFAVVRYTSAGELDRSFGAAGVVTTPLLQDQQRAEVADVALQPDGKIVVAGTVSGPAGNDFALLRYSPAGTLDPSFDDDGRVTIDFDSQDDRATALGVDEWGRIVVAGAAQLDLRSDFAALRLTSDGALDPGFSGDGKLRVMFRGPSYATDLLIQPQGAFVLAGSALVELKASDPLPVFALAMLDAQGRLDPTFDGDGMLYSPTTQGSTTSGAALAPGKKLVVAGTGAEGSIVLARYTLDGALDDTFADDGVLRTPVDSFTTSAYDVVTLPDSRIIVAGKIGGLWAFASFLPDGTPDNSFDGDGRLLVDPGLPGRDGARSLVRAPEGRLLAAGGTMLLRLFADGSADAGGRQLTSFGAETISGSFATLAQPDGRIVSVGLVEAAARGSLVDLALARHLPSGALDPSFGDAGTSTLGREERDEVAADALLQPDGKIFVVGSTSESLKRAREAMDLLLARFNADGTPDSSCGDAGLLTLDVGEGVDDQGQAVAIQADGKILVAGEIRLPEGNRSFVLRLKANCGSPDPAFGKDGLVVIDESAEISELLMLPAGQVQLVGTAAAGGVFLARLGSDGTFDEHFGSDGNVTTPLEQGVVGAAALLPDGKLLVAAAHRPDAAERLETLLLRYTSSGALDHSFGEQGVVAVDLGPNGLPTALALRDDGAFALVGCYDNFASPPVALFKPDGTFDRSFGTGGKAELAFGERTCTQDVVFSSRRLLVGGFAGQGTTVSFALAAYDTGEQRALGFAPAQATVPESATTAMLTVRLSQTAAQTVTVQYDATGGSAINGKDFTLAPGTLIFAPGQTAQRIPIALANDTTDEPDETVVITLNSPNNAVLGTNASFTLTIADDGGTEPPSAPYRTCLPLVQT